VWDAIVRSNLNIQPIKRSYRQRRKNACRKAIRPSII
jgi:hypothetical protein